MSNDGIYPEATKVENVRKFSATGIKQYVSDGHTKCKRCGNKIAEGETHMWVRGQGSFHDGKCPPTAN